MSPPITVELFQSASSALSVVDTTYFGIAFIFLPNLSSPIDGHAFAKPW